MSGFGLYVHIPFCASKCPYCDFFSGKGIEKDFDRYMTVLKDKIGYWGSRTNRQLTTIYFGGGTPSVIGTERLSSLLETIHQHFNVSDNAEITCEVNPDSGKTLDFNRMKQAGFNRISVGMQSALENEQKALGRIHTTKDVIDTIERVKSAGIGNISLDLMLGIPFQTKESLKQSIDFCASCGVKHISCYLLKIEAGTRFDEMRDTIAVADEDGQAELYLYAVEYMERLGFHQYEISNFSLPGYESRHNSAYWQCGEYIGIGPSAHSFYEGKRFFYGRSMEDFEKNITIPDGAGGDEEEYILLSLRLKSGLVFSDFEQRYGHAFPQDKLLKANGYVRQGWMELDNDHLCFTPKGFLLSNAIISELI